MAAACPAVAAAERLPGRAGCAVGWCAHARCRDIGADPGTDPAPGQHRRPSRAVGRWRTVPDPRRAGQQLQQLSGGAGVGVAGDPRAGAEHGAGAGRLGAGGTGRGPLRFLLRRHAAGAGAHAAGTAGAAVVRHLEEQRPQLRAALGQDRRCALSARGHARRATPGFAVAAGAGHAGGRSQSVRRRHAASAPGRSAAHRDHGAGRERARHLRQCARLLADGAARVRRPGATGVAAAARQVAWQLGAGVRRRCRRDLPCLAHRALHRPYRRGRQGRVSLADLRQCGIARPVQSRPARAVRQRRPHR
ncbi:hypothetical protein NB706_001832 [Xanthomonas sacchari]|nr:hypothetical protein [Xanthomonas sacchari]